MTKFDADNLPLREHYSPSDEDRARVQKALGVQLGVGAFGAAEVLSRVGSAGTSQVPPAATLVGASTKTTGSLLQLGFSGKILLVTGASTLAVALGLGLSPGRGSKKNGEAATVPTRQSPSGANLAEGSPPLAPSEKPNVSGAADEARTSTETGSERVPETISPGEGERLTSPERDRARKSPPVEGTLGRETALLAGASRALREGKPEEADQVLDRHAAEFGQGRLAQEREGLRLLSSCQSQVTPTLLREASRFVATYPQSPLVKHLRRACREEVMETRASQNTREGVE